MKKDNKTWLISKAVIQAGDIEPILLPVDPEQLSDAQIYGLHGQVRLRIPGTNGPQDIFCDPVARAFFRKLHTRWPWAGYFLRLVPITPKSTSEQIVDLSAFMALAFCHCEHLGYCETDNNIGLQYNPGELGKHIAELSGRAEELANIVGIPPKAIKQREILITESVVSFFDYSAHLNPRNRR